MPYTYSIDTKRRLVVSRASGVFTPDDVLAVRKEVARDPAFDPTFDQVIDLSAATNVQFDYDAMLEVAATSLSRATVRRALVARTAQQHSLACIFQVACEQNGQRVDIFKSLDEATEWLSRAHSEPPSRR